MSYHCKYCGKSHANVETGRECYRLWQEKRDADKAASVPNYPVGATGVAEVSGHYALSTPPLDGMMLVEVIVPAGGTWRGYVFMNLYDRSGTQKEAITDSADRNFIGNQIMDAGRRESMVQYGKHTGLCPVCNESLVIPDEADAGYHQNPVVTGVPCYMAINQ
jgi:hypothetical protein